MWANKAQRCSISGKTRLFLCLTFSNEPDKTNISHTDPYWLHKSLRTTDWQPLLSAVIHQTQFYWLSSLRVIMGCVCIISKTVHTQSTRHWSHASYTEYLVVRVKKKYLLLWSGALWEGKSREVRFECMSERVKQQVVGVSCSILRSPQTYETPAARAESSRRALQTQQRRSMKYLHIYF